MLGFLFVMVLSPKPPYKSGCSPADAARTLEWAKKTLQDTSIDQNEIPKLTYVVENLTELLNDYGAGRAVFEAMYPYSQVGSLTEKSNENIPLQSYVEKSEEINYPKKINLPSGFESSDTVSLSQANYNDLKKDNPFGSIVPPQDGSFFINQELLTPRNDGFINNLGIAECYPQASFIDFLQAANSSKKQVDISIPADRSVSIIPVPSKAQLSSIDSPNKIAKPTNFDPLLWRIKPRVNGLKYSIQELDDKQSHQLDLAANPDLLPNQDEQQYWRQALPIPAKLQSIIDASPPRDLARLLVSYLGIKNQETGLSNFRYQANADINKFMQDNKADLPLIVSELKSGHCDTLSWYLAALLRAQGRAAWVSRGLVTTNQGSAFQGAYGHAVVVTADENNKLIQIDPTQYVQHDPAYLPDEFALDDFFKMRGKFAKAKTNASKQQYLREFNTALQQTREAIKNDPARQKRVKDFMLARAGHFAALGSLDFAEKLNLERALSRQIVNYQTEYEANRRYSVDEICGLLPLGTYNYFVPELYSKTRSTHEYTFIRSESYTKIEKENLRRAFEISKTQGLCIATYVPVYSYKEMLLCQEKRQHELVDAGRLTLQELSCWQEAFDLQSLLKVLSVDTEPNLVNSHQILSNANQLLLHQYSPSFLNDFKNNFFYIKLEEVVGLTSVITIEPRDDIPIRDLSLKDARKYLQDVLYFFASVQKAFADPVFRKSFLTKINRDESFLRKLAEVFLYDHKGNKATISRKDGAPYQKYDKDFFYPLYLKADDSARLQRLFRDSLRGLDTNFLPARVWERNEARPYQAGDDFASIDWNLTARSESTIVRQSPVREIGVNSPLHVLVDVDDSTMTRLQILELIKTLQADIKKTGREVLITSKTDGLSHEYYFKLDPKVDPRIIVQTLMEFPKNNTRKSASHLDHKGQPFSAFLYVGSGYNSVAGMQYLYSKLPKHKLATIYLKEPKYDVYPLIQDSWVNEK